MALALEPSPSRAPANAPRRRRTKRTRWHALGAGDALRELDSSRSGISAEEAARRLGRHGRNELPALPPRSRLSTLVDQFANLPTALLAGSATISAALRDWIDAGSVLGVLGLNGGIGYAMERKSEQLLASWRTLEAGRAQVLRGGRIRRIRAAELVPGDVMLVRAGDTIAADARVLEAHRLSCDEAPLTGESEASRKDARPVARGAPLADRTSMLHAGTRVATGHGRAVVVATGAGTEVARLRSMIEEQGAVRTPLERRLRRLGNAIAWTSLGAGATSTVAALLHGRPPGEAIRGGIALGVAAMPEGLPAMSVAALVQAMSRMRRHGVVVRRLAAAETLGGITVLCVDKTGTLTENDMRLETLEVDGRSLRRRDLEAVAKQPLGDPVSAALAAGALNSDVDLQTRRDGTPEISGSSTEKALVLAAHAAGLELGALREAFPRRSLLERGEGRHYVASLHDGPDGPVVFAKGAPEQVLALCSVDERGREMEKRRRESILRKNQELAADGCRVLALAWRRAPRRTTSPSDGGYTFAGLVGLRDPLRKGAADAIRRAERAGIRVVILTGDQKRTALSVARELGLKGGAIDGTEVARTIKRNGNGDLRGVSVISRVAPADKVAIVERLKEQGEIVAMVGDGVNDAPALKRAHVGVAVGVASSDLARQAADVVLEREDLGALIAAIAEGRVVQDNLRRSVRFLVASNAAEVGLSLAGTVLRGRELFTPLQLLWINLLSDTMPALALALEPGRTDVLDRPPAPPDAPLLPRGSAAGILKDGASLAAIAGSALLLGGAPAAFQALSAAEIGYALACRAPGTPFRRESGPLFAANAALQASTLVLSPLRRVLGMPPVASMGELGGFAIGLGTTLLAAGLREDVIVVDGRAASILSDRRTRAAGRGCLQPARSDR